MCYDFRLSQGKTKAEYEPQREKRKAGVGKYPLDIDTNGSRKRLHVPCKQTYATANSLICKRMGALHYANLYTSTHIHISPPHSPVQSALNRYLITGILQLKSSVEVCRWWAFSCKQKHGGRGLGWGQWELMQVSASF